MKLIIFMVVTSLVGVVNAAGELEFVAAYDTGKYEDAAKMIDALDVSRPDVARRLGVMYFNAKGIVGDQMKGLELLEQAMMAGDAIAAVNLTKIYYKIENNYPKAAWCLMVAEGLKDVSVKDDVVRLRSYLGDDYLKGVASYIAQLRDLLSSEHTALKNKTAEADRERTSLTMQITSCQEEAKKKDEAFAREREELKSAKDDLGKKLVAAEDTADADKKKIEKLSAELAQNISDKEELDELLKKLKREHAEVVTEAKRAEESLAGYKKIVKTMDVGPIIKNHDVEKISSKKIFDRYNQLVEKYNLLVRKYNKLLQESEGSVSGRSGM